MSTAERVTPQLTVIESTPERMIVGIPDVHVALSELERRRGELFCNFGFLAIDIGVIPAEGPVMAFEETTLGNDATAGYLVLKHDGAVRFNLGNSGRSGGVPIDTHPPVKVTDDIKEYIGTVGSKALSRPLPNGPTAVVVSGEAGKTAKYDITRDTLAIGTRTVGAFALVKTRKKN
jgi:hypothetical protein